MISHDDDDDVFDEFLVKFNNAFPMFALSPDEIFKFWSKNERKRVAHYSLTPNLDKRMDEAIEALEEVQE